MPRKSTPHVVGVACSFVLLACLSLISLAALPHATAAAANLVLDEQEAPAARLVVGDGDLDSPSSAPANVAWGDGRGGLDTRDAASWHAAMRVAEIVRLETPALPLDGAADARERVVEVALARAPLLDPRVADVAPGAPYQDYLTERSAFVPSAPHARQDGGAASPAATQDSRLANAPTQAPPPAPLAAAASFLPALLAWALRAVSHRTRQRVHDLVAARPGLSRAELARMLGLDPTTVRHHLRSLARAGLIVRHDSVEGPRYFVPGSTPRAARDAIVATRSRAHVLHALSRGPLSKSDLAAALGVARTTVDHHLARLLAAGLVTARREGRCVLVAVAPEAANQASF